MRDPYETLERVIARLGECDDALERVATSLGAIRDDLDPRVLRYRVGRAHSDVLTAIRVAIQALSDRELREAFRVLRSEMVVDVEGLDLQPTSGENSLH